jgi:LysR family transcriptional activator of nhaA
MYRSGVDVLNHHHLYHFWTLVREGGVTRASEKLNVSQPTVSGQLRELQEALGEKLLVRSGRTVVLTDVGRTVYRYADEIFALGRELQQAVKGRTNVLPIHPYTGRMSQPLIPTSPSSLARRFSDRLCCSHAGTRFLP